MYAITYGRYGNESRLTAETRKQAESLYGKMYAISYTNGLHWTIKMWFMDKLITETATR